MKYLPYIIILDLILYQMVNYSKMQILITQNMAYTQKYWYYMWGGGLVWFFVNCILLFNNILPYLS